MPPDIDLILTPWQAAAFLPFVRRQPAERKGLLLLATAAPYLDGNVTKLHFQAQFVSQSAASKILKIIRNDNTK